MSVTKLNENLNIIAALADEPTQSAAELKAKFDSAGLKIKSYINDTLTEEIDTLASGIPQVSDELTSSDTTKALSAKQGKLLNESKQAKLTGAATTIAEDNLSASLALISDANGKVAVSVVSADELSYLSGVNSALQTQLNAKQKTITSGTADPTGGADGDIYLKYEA